MDNCIKYKDYQYKALKRPTTLPLSLTEVKAFLKVTTNTQDDLITTLIKSVVNYAESYTHIEFLTKQFLTFRDSLDFPIEIRKSKLVQIDSIKYFDDDNVLQTFASSNYYSDFNNFYSQIYLEDDADTSGITLSGRYDNVLIDFWAGFGIPVESAVLASNLVTITTKENHYLTTGQSVIITGADQTYFNGNFTITVTGDKTFTYAVTQSDITATGTIFVNIIPDDLKLAMLNHINRVFSNRGDCEAGNKAACDCSSAMNLPAETVQIYNMYRIIEVGI